MNFSTCKVLILLLFLILFMLILYSEVSFLKFSLLSAPPIFTRNKCDDALNASQISVYRDLRNLELPSPITALIDYSRFSQKRNFSAHNRDWVHPFVYEVFAECSAHPDVTKETVLYVIGQGINLHKHGRLLTVLGCVTNGTFTPIIQASKYANIFSCVLPKWDGAEKEVSLVIDDDKTLRNLIQGKEKNPAQKGETFEKDFETLSKWNIDAPRYNISDSALVVKSSATLHPGKCNLRLDLIKRDEFPLRYEICLMTQEKLFGMYLKPWVDYHRRIGVDRVYLYDNVIDEGKYVEDFFRGYDDVEVVHWPWQRSQLEAVDHFLLAARSRCQWVLIMDVDEYLMIGREKAPGLKEILRRKRCEGVSQIKFSEIKMGSSGHQKATADPLPERYVHKLRNQGKTNGKSAALSEAVYVDINIHTSKLRKGKTYSGSGKGDGYVIHYGTRSWEDTIRKLQGTRGSLYVKELNTSVMKHARDALPKDERRKRSVLDLKTQKEYVDFRDHWREVMHGRKIRMTSSLMYTSGNIECVVEVDPRTRNVVETKKCYRTM